MNKRTKLSFFKLFCLRSSLIDLKKIYINISSNIFGNIVIQSLNSIQRFLCARPVSLSSEHAQQHYCIIYFSRSGRRESRNYIYLLFLTSKANMIFKFMACQRLLFLSLQKAALRARANQYRKLDFRLDTWYL